LDNKTVFPSQIVFEQTEDHLHITFTTPFVSLSSAVFNGGFQDVNHLLNLKVPKQYCHHDTPENSLNNYCRQHQWKGVAVGMMTAASMKSLRIRQARVENIDILILVTAGLSNPRRAGDYAECRTLSTRSVRHDTINIILISTASFTPAAMVEAVMIITEAKAAALQTLNIKSPVSNQLATGTGTDSVILATQKTAKLCIEFCGKHTLMGELIGQLVIEAVRDSIQWDRENNNYD